VCGLSIKRRQLEVAHLGVPCARCVQVFSSKGADIQFPTHVFTHELERSVVEHVQGEHTAPRHENMGVGQDWLQSASETCNHNPSHSAKQQKQGHVQYLTAGGKDGAQTFKNAATGAELCKRKRRRKIFGPKSLRRKCLKV
jgi:hypothetical protein